MVWMGTSIDLGFYAEMHDNGFGGETNYLGLQILPQLCVEIHVIRTPGFKLSIPIHIGAVIVPFSKLQDSDDFIEGTAWDLSPLISIGIAWGS
jgi:hypothetical protein